LQSSPRFNVSLAMVHLSSSMALASTFGQTRFFFFFFFFFFHWSRDKHRPSHNGACARLPCIRDTFLAPTRCRTEIGLRTQGRVFRFRAHCSCGHDLAVDREQFPRPIGLFQLIDRNCEGGRRLQKPTTVARQAGRIFAPTMAGLGNVAARTKTARCEDTSA